MYNYLHVCTRARAHTTKPKLIYILYWYLGSPILILSQNNLMRRFEYKTQIKHITF